MTTRTTFKMIAITMAALGTAAAPAAFAAPSTDISVKIDTRYLETDWGVEKVYNTLSRKAENACSSNGSKNISARKYERECMTDLLDGFIKNAGHEKLTTYHTSAVK